MHVASKKWERKFLRFIKCRSGELFLHRNVYMDHEVVGVKSGKFFVNLQIGEKEKNIKQLVNN